MKRRPMPHNVRGREQYYSLEAAARMLSRSDIHVSSDTLHNWAVAGKTPSGFKLKVLSQATPVGRHRRYMRLPHIEALREFLKTHPRSQLQKPQPA